MKRIAQAKGLSQFWLEGLILPTVLAVAVAFGVFSALRIAGPLVDLPVSADTYTEITGRPAL